MARKQLSNDKIIEATLQLIETKGSANEVNFREIARSLNCAHTSLYNFYTSYQTLLSQAAQVLVERMRQELATRRSQFGPVSSSGGELSAYASGVIDYALEHPGLYRFLWMDYMEASRELILKGQPSPEQLLLKEFMSHSPGQYTPEEALRILQVSHSYIHGELCKWLSGRSAYPTPDQLKISLLAHLKWLCEK